MFRNKKYLCLKICFFAGDIVMTSHPLVFTTELTSSGIQESDINVPAMQYMVA